MTRQEIIKKVVSIIVRHAQPERVWLFGSEAQGEATSASDIDIAFEAPQFKDDQLIQDEISQLSTLIKIDVKNLSFTNDRFRNRVKSTGRSLYSGTKALRAEDGLHNFSKALAAFENIVGRREEIEKNGYGDIYLDLAVKRFEFTYEMSWKAIKRYLSFVGIEARSPRECFKEAYAQGLLADESVWLDMIESRNLTSHVYDENETKEILEKVQKYCSAFKDLSQTLGENIARLGTTTQRID